tara:strand:- start:3126 stop:3443 length:318 start_codon:yes stop_codon:yes gene_type:complete
MEQPNKSYIYSLSEGDKTFEKKLIDIIQKEFPQEKKTYYDSITVGDYKKTAEIVHKLKHKISILGLEKSYEDAIAFENNLLDGNNKLQHKFESILTTITNYLYQL